MELISSDNIIINEDNDFRFFLSFIKVIKKIPISKINIGVRDASIVIENIFFHISFFFSLTVSFTFKFSQISFVISTKRSLSLRV